MLIEIPLGLHFAGLGNAIVAACSFCSFSWSALYSVERRFHSSGVNTSQYTA